MVIEIPFSEKKAVGILSLLQEKVKFEFEVLVSDKNKTDVEIQAESPAMYFSLGMALSVFYSHLDKIGWTNFIIKRP